MAILVNINFYTPREWYNITDKEKFSGESWEKQLTISIFDYLPIYATLPPVVKAPDIPEVLEGDVDIVEYKKYSDKQIGVIIVNDNAILRAPLFAFPGMEVTSNGEVVEHRNDDCRDQEFCLGLITFNLDKGKHNIIIELKDTMARKVGNIVTLFSIIYVGVLIFYDKDKKYGKDKKVTKRK